MSQANKFSLSIGLKIQEAILLPLKDINKDDKIHLEIQIKEKQDDFIYKCIYLKDQKSISNDTWQSLITFLKNDLAPLSQIRSKKKYLNSLIPVHENSNLNSNKNFNL